MAEPDVRKGWRPRESVLARPSFPWIVLVLIAVTALTYAAGVGVYCSRYGGTDCSWGFEWAFAGVYIAVAGLLLAGTTLTARLATKVVKHPHFEARSTVFRSLLAVALLALPVYAVIGVFGQFP